MGSRAAWTRKAMGKPIPKRSGRVQRPLMASQGQDWGKVLERQLVAVGLVLAVSEHQFAHPRRWRFDLAFLRHRLAVEIEGGVWTQGRHTRGSGFVKDMEKYNEAAILGYRILKVTPEQVKNGQALKLVERALA